MDYETGIATGPADLVSKLATFAGSNGWTVNTPTSGRVFVKGPIYVGVSWDANAIYLRGALGYSSGSAWNAQPNNSGLTNTINTGAGPFTAYHFFAGAEDGAEYLHVAIEYASGKYRHISFGSMIKHGSWTGGTYVDGTYWEQSVSWIDDPNSTQHQVICDANSTVGSGHFWADYDSKVNNWQQVNISDFSTSRAIGCMRTNGINQLFPTMGYARWNLRNFTCPLIYFANRPSNLRSAAGRIPNMRAVGLHNLEPGTTLSIGGDDWKVFPVAQRIETFINDVESSAMYGYAYKMPPP